MALLSLHRDHLDAHSLEQTLGCVLKVHEDRGVVGARASAMKPILEGTPAAMPPG